MSESWRKDGTAKYPPPLDPVVAAERLKEVNHVSDRHGIVFWLGSGTCFGGLRENRFIPWDYEIGTAPVILMHGLIEETVCRMAGVFQDKGFHA